MPIMINSRPMTLSAIAFALDITPDFAVHIGGHKKQFNYVTKVLDRLEANCVIFKKNNEIVILISFDLLYVGYLMRKKIEEGLASLGIPKSSIFICATHTHHAPMVDQSKPLLGKFDENYLEWLTEVFLEKVRVELDSKFSSVDVEIGTGKSKQGVSRRSKRFKYARDGKGFLGQYVMKPNYVSSIDDTIRRMIIRNKSTGIVISEIWSASIHPTARTPGAHLSADYPGFVRSKLRKFHERDIPVLFLQGFSGDVRPNTGRRSWNPVKIILNGGSFANFSQSQYIKWSDKLSEDVLSIELSLLETTQESSIRIRRVQVDSNFFTVGGSRISGYIHFFYLLNMVFVGFPAEVVSGYAIKLNNNPFPVWPIGCIDHVFSYVPTQKMLSEGGYEVHGFRKYFGCGPLNEEIESQIEVILGEI